MTVDQVAPCKFLLIFRKRPNRYGPFALKGHWFIEQKGTKSLEFAATPAINRHRQFLGPFMLRRRVLLNHESSCTSARHLIKGKVCHIAKGQVELEMVHNSRRILNIQRQH
jgi:hypothetical protein